jgi:hypothetical protein
MTALWSMAALWDIVPTSKISHFLWWLSLPSSQRSGLPWLSYLSTCVPHACASSATYLPPCSLTIWYFSISYHTCNTVPSWKQWHLSSWPL